MAKPTYQSTADDHAELVRRQTLELNAKHANAELLACFERKQQAERALKENK
jgi:hypothetical protein